MNTTRRSTAVLLLLAMLLSASACSQANTEGNTDGAEQTDTSALNAEENLEEEPEVDELADNLPETDLDGYDFRISCYLDSQIESIFVDSYTGNPVNDSVYEKIITTEDRFNCNVSLVEYAGSVGESLITSPIRAGDDVFDIATGHDITIANATLQGMFLNLYKVPHLDFTRPWWPAQTVKSLTVNGCMYLFSNLISYYSMATTGVWYFNKDLFEDMGLPKPYDQVYEGTWTLDAMNQLVDHSYLDLNGNGERDEKDQYGVVNGDRYYCFLEPFNMEPYRHTADGGLEYVFDVERYSTLIEKFAALLYGESGMTNSKDPGANFRHNRALMIYEAMEFATNTLSQTDVVYGVLPMPKLDETQDQYYGGCTDRPMVVPITAVSHLEQTGLLIEALSAEGYRKVYPAYFEKALKSRYADQTDDAKMIDIIMNNNILSLTYMYGNYSSPYSILMTAMFGGSTPKTDVASFAAKQETGQQARVAKIMEGFDKVREQQE